MTRTADTTPARAAKARRQPAWASLAVGALLVAGCGGGGGSAGGGSEIAQSCAPTNPYVADASSPTTLGSLDNEKAWLHAYMSGAYLWYGEMPSVDAGAAAYSSTADVYGSMDNYFEALKTPAFTGSGKRRDEFSFTYPTKAWNDLINSGAVYGYGIEWVADSWNSIPRGIRIAYIEPGSPAGLAGLQRGDVLLTADGVSADSTTTSGKDTLNTALYPSVVGQLHNFVFSRPGSNPSANLVSANITKQPVPTTTVLNSGGKKVGYMVFTDHLASAEQPLIDAINTMKAAAVDDLVIDLRYNGGGYLYIASELAYMVAGGPRTTGQIFEALQYNIKRSADTNSPDAKTPFYDTSCILNNAGNCTRQQPLPTLGLSRVTVIATASTCSASEALINGLRGVDVDVRVIGDTTCGKPYGFTAKDNCGISYFPIEFKGVNAKGYGDYADGFPATCPASDDFAHALGDANEGMLAAALYNQQNNTCNLVAAQQARRSVLEAATRDRPRLLRGPERENRILLPRR